VTGIALPIIAEVTDIGEVVPVATPGRLGTELTEPRHFRVTGSMNDPTGQVCMDVL